MISAGIDVSRIFWHELTGTHRYLYGLISGIAAIDEMNGIRLVLVDRNPDDSHEAWLPLSSGVFEYRSAKVLKWISTKNIAARMQRTVGVWNRTIRFLRRYASRLGGVDRRIIGDLDVFHVWTWDIHPCHRKNVITIHDLLPVLFPEQYTKKFRASTWQALDFARDNASMVIVPSECTKRDLMREIGIESERIQVIYHGVDQRFHPIEDLDILNSTLVRYGLDRSRYLLSVGYLDWRKNSLGHVRAFERLVASGEAGDLLLVFAGPKTARSEEILSAIHNSKVHDRIRFTGYVAESDLSVLISGAKAFLYCSHYEGFGIPVLEAMACGVPVVTSNTSSLPEVAGDAALLVDPNDTGQIADAVRCLVSDGDLYNKLARRGLRRSRDFTWERCAREHLEVYRNCCESRPVERA